MEYMLGIIILNISKPPKAKI